ncbi:YicC/YloC family endoribonuclease [Natranaerobius trueperi]|uniref:YicC family protein n=1 Tax=Natranaerobius trueperi TaxID=759412 RepID=A0A226C168_9FIRM|nr:YicC/YloC family endoribonuclease [Natranaerobius trueperi]OWZ84157.1 YicC family protein [Natranaerobius trueperi]
MVYSMTGFGSSKLSDSELEGKIEIKTLNHKYLDIQVKGPRELFSLEESIRKMVSDRISRGRIEIRFNIKFTEQHHANAELNKPLAESYLQGLTELKEMTEEHDRSLLSIVSRLPEVFILQREEVDDSKLWQKIQSSLNEALDELLSMKEREGDKLKADIITHKNNLNDLVSKIYQLKDRSTDKVKGRLKDRVGEMIEDQNIDENRILQEVAILSDKANIDEELVRINSHINQMNEVLEESGSIGRKLDFIVQEMNREINTIASKANDEEISQLVIEAKSTIEKIREQVQNVE